MKTYVLTRCSTPANNMPYIFTEVVTNITDARWRRDFDTNIDGLAPLSDASRISYRTREMWD
jgi:hypothetical protein